MKKLTKRFNKHNSVEAYSCMCWMSLASCSCACYSCFCSDNRVAQSTIVNIKNASITNETAYTSHLQANKNNKP